MMVDLRKMMVGHEDVEMRTHKSNGAPLRVVSVDIRKEFRVPTTMFPSTPYQRCRRALSAYNDFHTGEPPDWLNVDDWDEDFMTFHD